MLIGRVSFIAFLMLLLIYTTSDADIYKYVGEDGVVLYTNTPFSKKNARIIKEKENSDKESISSSKTKNKVRDVSSTTYNDNYRSIVHKKAKEHEIDPSLVHAVIKTESNGNPYAISRKGAMGLMQLMPVTASNLQVKNPFDPEENIDGGIRYLRYLIERFDGNLTLALAAYNAGPKVVEKYGCIPPILETKQYVKKVLTLYDGKVSSGSNKSKNAEPIYKVVMEDGTVLFTNFPLYKMNSIRF